MSQLNLFSAPEKASNQFIITNGEYIYVEHFFDSKQSQKYFNTILQCTQWKQEKMNMYGRELLFPRLTAWHGDRDKSYTFSGITLQPNEWSTELFEIKRKIETKINVSFNSVLLNRYRDGNDSISWHTDAEKELGINPVIASVNFGATRKFQLKHIHNNERIDLDLANGSLLIMKGELQHYWKHQIPKTRKKVGERINLTFRMIQ